MFCPRCGNNIKEGSAFCSGCGFKLDVSSEPTEQPLPDATQPAQPYEAIPTYDEDYTYNEPMADEKSIHYKHSADTIKKSNKKKTVISIILIVAILAFSAVSFFLLNGINGKWVYDECLINEKSLSEAFKETAQSEKSVKDSVKAVNDKYKNDNLEFIFGDGTINFNGLKAEGPYEIIDNKLYVDSKSIAGIDSSFSSLKLTFTGHPLGDSAADINKTTVIFQRDWIQLAILGGIFVILIVALVINLLTGRKPKNKNSTTVDATYDLSVNPLNDEPNTGTKSHLSAETIPQYSDETFNDAENTYVNPVETDYSKAPVVDFNCHEKSFDNMDLYSTKYAPTPEHVVTPKQADNNYVNYKTKYISNQDVVPKNKDVEIIITPETSIPNVNPEEYSISPGKVQKDDIAADIHITKVTAAPISETPSAPMAEVPTAPSPEAHAAPSAEAPTPSVEKAQPAQKKPANPFFKSAGDL